MRDVTVLVYPGQNRQDPSPDPGGSSCPLAAWRCWGWLPHHPGLVGEKEPQGFVLRLERECASPLWSAHWALGVGGAHGLE